MAEKYPNVYYPIPAKVIDIIDETPTIVFRSY